VTDGLTLTIAGATGTLTLDRPARRNAISLAMWQGLPAAVATLAADPAVRAIVLRGAGGHFAAGADITEFDTAWASRAAAAAYADSMAAAMAALRTCEIPVIAAIEGNCIGGAVALTLSCDICIAAPTATFAITPARLGIAYAFGDTARLVGRIGAAAARDLLFTARHIDAAEAHQIGLIDRLGPLDPELTRYTTLLAATSRASQRVAKDFIARALAGQSTDDAHTEAAYLDILDEPDFTEGKAAFRAKRKPVFR
jgi:enoyl-CoA hydratase/carnithine racemase